MSPSTQDKPQKPQSNSIVRSAGIVSIAIGMSRITGLIREIVFARLFGAGFANDAFQIAFRIPNLTRDLFAEGALSSAFVPVFTEYLTTKSRKDAAHLANLVTTSLILIVGSMCLLGIIFSPALVEIFAHGFHDTPGKFELAVYMTRIMFPFLLLVALAAQAMGVLNACDQFGVPAMASTFFNIGSLAFGLMLGYAAGPRIGLSPIEGMAYGVVLGGALQLFWQVPSLYKRGFSFRPALDWTDPGLRRIFGLMVPAIIGNAAVQINVMVNSNFATGLSDPIRGHNGPVSWLGYAFRFMQLPLGLFGVAIASATLPSISRSAASGNILEFRNTLSRSLGMVFLLTVPSSVGLAVLGPSIVGAVYEGRAFKFYDTQQTALALACYSIGLAGYSAVKVLNPAFYALNDARTPMIISFASIVINFATAYSMIHFVGLGHAGLALSTSAVALFNALALFILIRYKTRRIYGRSLLESVVKIAIASAVMGAIVWLTSHEIAALLGHGRRARLVDLAVSIPIGLVALYGAARLLKIAELEVAMQSLAGPLRRRLPFLRGKIGS